jgi:hypothetical protein
MEPIYDVEQYKWLYLTSHLTLLSSGYAFYVGYPIISFLQFLIFTTSINYWRLPDYSWRRYLDMAVVKSFVLYHNIYLGWDSENAVLFWWIFAFGSLTYPIGFYVHSKGYRWLSMYLHAFMHILACIDSIYLYTGAIPRANSLLI